jgi:hypothetical protein
MDVVNGMFIGAVIGLIVALPAIYSEIFRQVKDLPILVDVHACWDDTCTDEEVFTLSLFIHMLFSITFGGLYMALYLIGWVHNFSFFSILGYTALFYVFLGGIILPLIRLGAFGRREGKHVWAELLLSNLLFGLGFWAALRLFPVFLPF